MTSYRKTMGEVYRSMYIVEDNMDQMRKAAKGAMQTIKFKDGKLKVDSFTASAIMGVYDKVNSKNKSSMENMINSGTKAQIMKLQSLAMKSIKSENDPTVDEHVNGKPHPHPHEDEEEGELATTDEGPNKAVQTVIVMRHKDNKNLSVSVLPSAKNIKAQEKKGMRIAYALVPRPSGASSKEVKDPKEIMKLIKGGDKLNIGEDYVLTVKDKEVNRYKSEKDARKAFHDLVQNHGP
ncbi:uncharacterized protein METZ01_LOCUS345967, partial [marine metagenome]